LNQPPGTAAEKVILRRKKDLAAQQVAQASVKRGDLPGWKRTTGGASERRKGEGRKVSFKAGGESMQNGGKKNTDIH